MNGKELAKKFIQERDEKRLGLQTCHGVMMSMLDLHEATDDDETRKFTRTFLDEMHKKYT